MKRQLRDTMLAVDQITVLSLLDHLEEEHARDWGNTENEAEASATVLTMAEVLSWN